LLREIATRVAHEGGGKEGGRRVKGGSERGGV